ncbi:MCM2, partial [Symbiodinium sp. KB8]
AHPAYTGEETSAGGQAAATGAGASEDAHGASTQDSGAVGGSTQDSTLGSQASVASGGDSGLAPISQDLLRKYIVYAKQHCKPALTEINQEKIAQLYADLRRESEVSNGIPMAVRHIESMIMVTDEDVNMAIRMMLESFIQAQKFAVMRTLRRQFAKYMDHGRDFNQLLMFKLQELVRHAHAKDKLGLASGVGSGGAEVVHEDGGSLVVVPIKDLQERARRHGIQDLASFLRSREFTSYGFKHNPTAERVELRLTQRL